MAGKPLLRAATGHAMCCPEAWLAQAVPGQPASHRPRCRTMIVCAAMCGSFFPGIFTARGCAPATVRVSVLTAPPRPSLQPSRAHHSVRVPEPITQHKLVLNV